MILPLYLVNDSTIAGAGKGLFLAESIGAGKLIVAPDDIKKVYKWNDILNRPDSAEILPATVRWFEDRYTVTPEWPDECYINHAFEPTALWHLGFVFALSDLAEGTEITVDYRHLLAPGQREEFVDSKTGQDIVGYSWAESLSRSTAQLNALMVQAD